MSTRIYLARHGATQLSAEDRFAGAVGVDLSDEGRWQAERLGDRLARESVNAIYASPLSRTMETARILGDKCDIEPTPMDALREISHGRWEGLTRHEVEAQFPDEYAAWNEDPFTFAPEGGESGVAVLARVLPVIRTIAMRHRDQRVLVVSHKATIRILISSLLGFDARGYRDRLDQAPACLNVLDFRDAVHARLMLFNDTSHYSQHPRNPTHSLSKWWDE
ncbi:MAG TPA: histidine phosphatase family protein [Thermoanaerobaculia bacterium]|jgi:probable phosphoglycerate mutase|nr:histidine phosphatase family protein [Thermoanaerobaculia bacterium]